MSFALPLHPKAATEANQLPFVPESCCVTMAETLLYSTTVLVRLLLYYCVCGVMGFLLDQIRSHRWDRIGLGWGVASYIIRGERGEGYWVGGWVTRDSFFLVACGLVLDWVGLDWVLWIGLDVLNGWMDGFRYWKSHAGGGLCIGWLVGSTLIMRVWAYSREANYVIRYAYERGWWVRVLTRSIYHYDV